MKFREIQIGLVDATLTLVGLACTGLGVRALANSEPTVAITALGAGLVLLLAATIDRFESLKGLGMEAKTRKLTATITKAEETLSQLRRLTELVGSNLLKVNSALGRLDTAPSIMDAYALSRSVKDSLEAVGSSKATVATALEPWARIAAFDAVHDKIRKPGQVAFASAGKKIAKEASESLAGAEQAAQLARGAAVAGYFDTALRDCHQWQLRDYTKKLAQFIKSLPDAPAEVRDEITATTNTVSARIAYLAKELDFDDTAFWASIRD